MKCPYRLTNNLDIPSSFLKDVDRLVYKLNLLLEHLVEFTIYLMIEAGLIWCAEAFTGYLRGVIYKQ